MKVSFNRLAEAELIAATRYLETERKLGNAFLDEYAGWEIRIRAYPESCPEIAPGIRRGYLSRFKYHVTYSLLSGEIRILYIRSARQAPLRRWPRNQTSARMPAPLADALRTHAVGRLSSGVRRRADFGANRAPEYPEGISSRGSRRKVPASRRDATRPIA